MSSTRIFVAGHRGMVGAAITRQLTSKNCEIITRPRSELDLTNAQAVEAFFQTEKIDTVYLAAAKVGGIHANNTYPATFLADNLAIQLNVIQSAFKAGVQNLLCLGSSCIYPKHAPQPMPEKALLSGALEPTNEPYAIAKIAGLKLCESYNRQYGTDYRSVMPTNLYGPGDNFHPENSHVIPALMQRFHKAKLAGIPHVEIWGTGTPKREFLHVDDMASACLHVMELEAALLHKTTGLANAHINLGTGIDMSIGELAKVMAQTIGYQGDLKFDSSKADGAPRKLLDVSLLTKLGWSSSIEIETGLAQTYQWYLDNIESVRC